MKNTNGSDLVYINFFFLRNLKPQKKKNSLKLSPSLSSKVMNTTASVHQTQKSTTVASCPPFAIDHQSSPTLKNCKIFPNVLSHNFIFLPNQIPRKAT